MPETTTGTRTNARPYRPSWFDRFTGWVDGLPVPAWVFYVVFGIALTLVQVLVLWLDGGLHAVELVAVIIFNGLAPPYLLALIHLLDNQAMTAVNVIKPMLDATEQEFGHYECRLANMPLLAPLIAGLAMTIFTIVMELVSGAPIRYAALEQLPVFAVVFHIIDKSSAYLAGVFIYHTIRQLRLVNGIHSGHVRINLFDLKPLQAFSKLTASTALGLLAFVYPWVLINPELLADPVILGIVAMFTVLAAFVFIWPLYGMHRCIEGEKERVLHDIGLRFETVFSKLNQRLREDDYSDIEPLSSAISSLEMQQAKVKAIPTWPWRPETARVVLTAIPLPLVLQAVRSLVEQVLGW